MANYEQSGMSMIELIQMVSEQMKKRDAQKQKRQPMIEPGTGMESKAPQSPENMPMDQDEPGKFDKALGDAKNYMEIAQLFGKSMNAMKGSLPSSGGIPTARPVSGLSPSVGQFRRGSSQGGGASIEQLIALLSQGRR